MSMTARADVVAAAVARANAGDRPLYLIVIGTRPCYIKLASLLFALEARDVPFLIIESGQHYDWNLTSAKHEFGFHQLIGVNLNVRGPLALLGAQLYERVACLADLLDEYTPRHPPIPVVSGDTLTAGLFPQAWYLCRGVRAVHIEAGLRTYGPSGFQNWQDPRLPEAQRTMAWTMMRDEPFPEALCSRLASEASQGFFAPVERNRTALLSEGFDESRIFVLGSLSADAVSLPAMKMNEERSIQVGEGPWLRVDLHRRENMTSKRLSAVLGGLELLNSEGLRTLLILSNALKGALDRFDLWNLVKRVNAAGGVVQEPWPSYRSVIDFLKSSQCLAIYTDSGGLQEEACILGARCFTCRFGTDRVETVLDFGTNLLIPPSSAEAVAWGISSELSRGSAALKVSVSRGSPYGTRVGDAIARVLKNWVPQEARDGAFATHRR